MSRLFLLIGALAVGTAGLPLLLRDGPGGIGRLWPALAGPADQGPVDFASLRRRSTPNDALVCPPQACAATSDVAAPVYAASPDQVRAAVRQVVLSSPDVVQVGEASGPHGDRFVVRTRLLRFPDTVDILVIPHPQGATLAMYSRSLVGSSDFGANRARLAGWLADPRLTALERRR